MKHKKERKNNKIFYLGKIKTDSVEMLRQAIIDLGISHEEFKTIINEKIKKMKLKKT